MKYSLRSLVIVMLLAGPLSSLGWHGWQAWKLSQPRTCHPSLRHLAIAIHRYHEQTKRSP